ncbi:MAG: SulP family inorganic anion transporter [Sphingomonadaceae bacterium]
MRSLPDPAGRASFPARTRADLVAGLSIGGLILPEAVAYAAIAGLPPQHGLIAAIAGCFVYPLLGRSRFAVVSPTSSSALVLAAALATLPGSPEARAATGAFVTLCAGLMLMALAAGRLGGLSGFISRPVLRGFGFGLAVTIIAGQLPKIGHVPVPPANPFAQFRDFVQAAGAWHGPSVALGVGALVALLLLRRRPGLPGAFLVLAAGIGLSMALDLPGHGVATIGPFALALAPPALFLPTATEVRPLLAGALPLVLILFAESWGSIRTLGLRHGEQPSANRELAALGLANLASGLWRGLPVAAGFSASNAAEMAGAATRAAALFAGATLLALVLVATPAIEALPLPVLAAVVIAALTHALDSRPFRRLWRMDRDQLVALAAAAAVLALGVLDGMLVAVLLSIAALLGRLARPHVARLGRVGESHAYVDMARHPEARAPDGVTILRPLQPLFFANAEAVTAQLAGSLPDRAGGTRLVISLEESPDLDSTAAEALFELDSLLRQRGVDVRYARVHDRARDVLAAAGLEAIDSRIHFSVDDAVSAILSPARSEENERS